MEDTYDQQIANGKLVVEKTTVTNSEGKQVVGVKTTTILDPLIQIASLEDLQRQLGEYQVQKVTKQNEMDTIDNLIDYCQKVIVAVSNGKH